MSTLREAFALLDAGAFALAEDTARGGLRSEPGHPGWTTLLALGLSRQGKAVEALPLFEQLAEANPSVGAHWSNLGHCLCDLGRGQEAIAAFERASACGPADDAVHYGLARAHALVGPAARGLHHIDQALAIAPGDVEYRLLRVRLLLLADELPAAQAAARQLRFQTLDDALRLELARVTLECAQPQAALELFESLSGSAVGDAAATGRLLALERLNRIDDARALAGQLGDDAAIVVESTRRARTHARAKVAARAGALGEAEALYAELMRAGEADAAERATVAFDRATALAGLGRIDDAMACLEDAHAQARQHALLMHPALADTDLYAALDEPVPPPPDPASLPAADERAPPVFVVGFPRSGTTLLEQMLDAHPQLASFDEQPFVQTIARALYGRADTVAAALQALTRSDAESLRQRYFASVEALTGPLGRRRAVDKNPLNLIRLGMLPHVFPGATALLVLRHPCDVVLSCYMQHFSAPAFALTFATLDDCAHMYDRVFTSWARLPASVAPATHVLRYEDLVADTEAEMRRLLDALGLDWSPDVLDHAARLPGKAIGTPSYSQVVERVHGRAVGKWVRYRHHFSDRALGALAPWIRRFGYSIDA